MCGGNLPAAPESADLIAIIHPTQHQSHNTQQRTLQRPSTYRSLSGRLRLSNRHHPTTTTTEFQHASPSYFTLSQQQELLTVQIHKFGQPIPEHYDSVLSSSGVCHDELNPVLHRFPISLSFSSSEHDVHSIVGLGRRLDLGVGGEGIIGRTISVVNCDGGLLGQGIIGRI